MELKDIEQIKKIHDSVLIIDEIREYMDSYQSMSKKTRFVSNLCRDLGKQSCDFYFSDQNANAAPTRIQDNVQIYLYPQFDEKSLWCYVYAFWGQYSFYLKDPFTYFAFYAPDYWDYYDTMQKIEEYCLKFDAKTPAYQYMIWAMRNGYPAINVKSADLDFWNTTEGRGEVELVLRGWTTKRPAERSAAKQSVLVFTHTRLKFNPNQKSRMRKSYS